MNGIYNDLKERIVLTGDEAKEKFNKLAGEGAFDHFFYMYQESGDCLNRWFSCTCGHIEKLDNETTYTSLKTLSGHYHEIRPLSLDMDNPKKINYSCPTCDSDTYASQISWRSKNLFIDDVFEIVSDDGINFEIYRYEMYKSFYKEGKKLTTSIELYLESCYRFEVENPSPRIKRVISSGKYQKTKRWLSFFNEDNRASQTRKNHAKLLEYIEKKIPKTIKTCPVFEECIGLHYHSIVGHGVFGILMQTIYVYHIEGEKEIIELLAKFKLTALLKEVLGKTSSPNNRMILRNYLRVCNGDAPEKDSQMSPSVLPFIQEQNLNMANFVTLHSWFEADPSITCEDMNKFIDMRGFQQATNPSFLTGSKVVFYNIMKKHHISLRKIVEYLKALEDYQAMSFYEGTNVWQEYLYAKKYLEEKDNLFPNSLYLECQLAVKRKKAKKRKEKQNEYASVRKEIEPLEQIYGGYQVIVPKTLEEIEEDSYQLYYHYDLDKVIAGEVLIVFIRDKENPCTPLFSLIVQISRTYISDVLVSPFDSVPKHVNELSEVSKAGLRKKRIS